MRTINKECVGSFSAYKTSGIIELLFQTVRYAFKYLIAFGNSETLIENMEMINIKTQRIPVSRGIDLVELVSVTVKIFNGKESRQFVSFCGTDDLTVFCELDRT